MVFTWGSEDRNAKSCYFLRESPAITSSSMVSQTSCSVWYLSVLTVLFPVSWHAVCWGRSCRAILAWVGFSSCTTCPAVEQSQWGFILPQAQDCNLISGAAGPTPLFKWSKQEQTPTCWLRPPGPSAAVSTDAYLGLVPFFSPGVKLQPLHHNSMKNPWVTYCCDFFFLLESSRKFFLFVCLFCFYLLLSGRKGEDRVPFLHLVFF